MTKTTTTAAMPHHAIFQSSEPSVERLLEGPGKVDLGDTRFFFFVASLRDFVQLLFMIECNFRFRSVSGETQYG